MKEEARGDCVLRSLRPSRRVLWLYPCRDLAAQGLDECPDTEIASAVDNYRLSWVVSKGRLGAERATEDKPKAPDSPGTFWERVTDEAHDGADSLRSGTIGDNEHAELTALIAGGTTLSFWWKVDSQELADYLTFSAEPEIEVGTADGSSAPPTITVDAHRWEARLDQG